MAEKPASGKAGRNAFRKRHHPEETEAKPPKLSLQEPHEVEAKPPIKREQEPDEAEAKPPIKAEQEPHDAEAAEAEEPLMVYEPPPYKTIHMYFISETGQRHVLWRLLEMNARRAVIEYLEDGSQEWVRVHAGNPRRPAGDAEG